MQSVVIKRSPHRTAMTPIPSGRARKSKLTAIDRETMSYRPSFNEYSMEMGCCLQMGLVTLTMVINYYKRFKGRALVILGASSIEFIEQISLWISTLQYFWTTGNGQLRKVQGVVWTIGQELFPEPDRSGKYFKIDCLSRRFHSEASSLSEINRKNRSGNGSVRLQYLCGYDCQRFLFWKIQITNH